MLPITFMMALATLKASAQNPDFLTLIKAATQAPSGHNSQPWWFETSDHSIVIKPNFEKLTDAVLQGNTAQMSDPAFKNELLSWIRFNKKHSESTHDGLSYAVLGAPNLPRWVTEPIVKGSLKAKTQNKTDLKKIQSSSDMVLITTVTNDIPTWIATGRTLERFLLLLTQAGIAHAYLNQPCEVPEVNASLREKLTENNVYPQILLRIGYAKPVAYSKRKDVKEVMR